MPLLQHLRAERHVGRQHQQAGEERRQQDRRDRSRDQLISRAVQQQRRRVLSNRPNRSLALSLPPTVNGSTTAGMLRVLRQPLRGARVLVGGAHDHLRRLLRKLRVAACSGAPPLGSTPGFGSSVADLAHAEPAPQVAHVLVVRDDRHALAAAAPAAPTCAIAALQRAENACEALPGRSPRWRRRSAPGAAPAPSRPWRCCAGRAGCAGCRAACTSPSLRSTRVGTSSGVTKRPASKLAGAPAARRGLPDCWIRSGSQPISSSMPGADEQVGVAHARDQARPRLDVMRVLQRRRRRRDVDLVAAELLDERRPFGLAGDDVERAPARGTAASAASRRAARALDRCDVMAWS